MSDARGMPPIDPLPDALLPQLDPTGVRHLDAVLVAKEIRCMQHDHVQRLTLDPFRREDW